MNALVFKDLGYKVHVLERSTIQTLQSEAAGIRAGPELHAFIERYVPDHPEYMTVAEKLEIMDADGRIIQTVPPKHPLRLTTWKFVYDMLKEALVESDKPTPAASYQSHTLVQDVCERDKKMVVTSLDLTTTGICVQEADLVIAADGAHSTIRKKLCPEITPQYSGYVGWRGRVPESALSTETREAMMSRCVVLRVEGGFQISCVGCSKFTSGFADLYTGTMFHLTAAQGRNSEISFSSGMTLCQKGHLNYPIS